jgi:glycosyltransferase involved in cell wall biosynthesis
MSLIGIVIPSYRQPGLMAEALDSLLAQQKADWRAIVVVDGCPFVETRLVAEAYAALDDRIHWLETPNRGLSAARNAGVEYLLDEDDVDFVYFLDADNRLEPRALDLLRGALEADSGASWAYPSISMFGSQRIGGFDNAHLDYSLPFRPGRLLIENMCEAGSMFRAEALRAGSRFDEDMRYGFEDWELFRRLSSEGHRGLPAGHVGFRYRRRAESMLSESERSHARGLARELLEVKGAGPDVLSREIQLFNEEFPVIVMDLAEPRVELLSGFYDPKAPDRARSQQWLIRHLVGALLDSHAQHPGRTLILTDAAGWTWLRGPLRPAITFRLEAALARAPFAELSVDAGAVPGVEGTEASFLALDVGLLDAVVRDPSDEWLVAALAGSDGALRSRERLGSNDRAPARARPQGEFLSRCLAALAAVKRDVRGAAADTAGSLARSTSLMADRRLRAHWQERLNGTAAVPVLLSPGDGSVVSFAVPYCASGGVERAAAALSQQLRRAGFRTVLLLTEQAELPRTAWAFESFDAIVPLLDASTGECLGAPVPGHNPASEWEAHALPDPTPSAAAPGLGVLGVGGTLVIEHSVPALVRAASLRRRGVRIADHVHVFDRTLSRRPVGHVWLAVAHEHVIDAFVCSDPYWTDLMVALGVPREKCIDVPNAPFSQPRRDAAGRSLGQPLRVLFVGRAGPQKGWDRFLRVCDSLQHAPIEWHVVGDKTPVERWAATTVWQEPVDSLSEQIQDCDVVLITSDWEGIPLLVLEALAAGKTVLAPDIPPLCTHASPSPGLQLLPVDDLETAAISWLEREAQVVGELPAPATTGVPSWSESARSFVEWCGTSSRTRA